MEDIKEDHPVVEPPPPVAAEPTQDEVSAARERLRAAQDDAEDAGDPEEGERDRKPSRLEVHILTDESEIHYSSRGMADPESDDKRNPKLIMELGEDMLSALGGTFGDFADGVASMLSSPIFQSLLKNLTTDGDEEVEIPFPEPPEASSPMPSEAKNVMRGVFLKPLRSLGSFENLSTGQEFDVDEAELEPDMLILDHAPYDDGPKWWCQGGYEGFVVNRATE